MLADAANGLLEQLHHVAQPTPPADAHEDARTPDLASQHDIPGGIADADEEAVLLAVNAWLQERGLPPGELDLELADAESGEPLAILDLAWPNGLQVGLSTPVALLLDEPDSTLQIANDHGYRHFTDADGFKRYTETEILAVAGASESG